eukprot:5742424-Pyramimonas_sp.AAC.1
MSEGQDERHSPVALLRALSPSAFLEFFPRSPSRQHSKDAANVTPASKTLVGEHARSLKH